MGDYKSVDGLMRHLRNNKHIAINGSKQKQQLERIGYFHSYKGHRFVKDPINVIRFSDFEEVYDLVMFDHNLKSLLYPKLIQIEMGIRSIILEYAMNDAQSYLIEDIVSEAIGVKESVTPPPLSRDVILLKVKMDRNLRNSIYERYLYKDKPVSSYLDNNRDVPLWAIFEHYHYGETINFYESLTTQLKTSISRRVGINISLDTPKRTVLRDHLGLLKDLRNSVSHDNVVFDCRFHRGNNSRPAMRMIESYFSGATINFKSLTDYVILCAYYLNGLNYPKTDVQKFVREYEKLVTYYYGKYPTIATMFISTDDFNKITQLKRWPF